MNYRIRCAFLFGLSLIMVPFLQGCASMREPVFSPDKRPANERVLEALMEIKAMPAIPDNKAYKEDGHFYTVYYVAGLAGVGADRASRLSCFAQAPDDIFYTYNAISVAFKLIPLARRSHIMNGLHSLHGGDHSAVLRRQDNLKRLVNESYTGGKPDWQTGFLIHALGDSYAHVHGDSEPTVAYGEFVGHLFAIHDPDNISVGDNYKKYDAYAHALFDALAGEQPGEGRRTLQTFTDELPAVIQRSRGLGGNLSKTLAGNTAGTMTQSECYGFYAEIKEPAAYAFLAALAVQLE